MDGVQSQRSRGEQLIYGQGQTAAKQSCSHQETEKQQSRCFDLAGQLKSLKALQRACQDALVSLERDKDVRMRNYQTLGLCAGAALAIIFA